MPLAVATRTVIYRRWRLRFMWGSLRAGFQARRSPGYLAGSVRVTAGGPVFWTLTVWQDGAAMNAFRESGAHARFMPKLAVWGSQAAMTAWQVDADPSWDEVFVRMARSPRWPEVARPDRWQREKRMERTSRWGLTMPIPRRIAVWKPLPEGSSA